MSYNGNFPKIIKMPKLEVDKCVIPVNPKGSTKYISSSAGSNMFTKINYPVVEHQKKTKKESIKKNEETIRLELINKQCDEILNNAQKKAEEIIALAKLESSRILTEAQQKVNSIEEKAYKDGFQSGEKAGFESIQTALTQAQSVLKSILDSRSEIIENSESEVINLVIQIAEKVIKREVSDHKTVFYVVKDALQRLSGAIEIIICVNPDEVEILKENLSELQDFSENIIIKADPKISSGGCKLESHIGHIDARIETQFENISNSLLAIAESNKQVKNQYQVTLG